MLPTPVRCVAATVVASILWLAPAAPAADEIPADPEIRRLDARHAAALRSAARRPRTSGVLPETTFVGYNPAFAGSNWWSIGVGQMRPPAGGDPSRRGYWDFDTPVHGDSAQGWSAHRRRYTTTGGQTLPDSLRPWWALDFGNQTSAVGKSGPANAHGQKRTDGVIGAWHADPGNVITSAVPGTNPIAPSWTPLSGQRSAWCGLRGHGDLTAYDPITGNHYNAATNVQTLFNALSASGTDHRFPGYVGQWDQMLYRDVAIPGSGTVQVRFKLRTNMSTQVLTASATRAGWFDKDPLAVTPQNFVASTGNPAPPADSFMVYVGRPVEPAPGADNDWTGSDGQARDLHDPLRRWFAEVVHAFDGSHRQLLSLGGTHATATRTVSFDAGALAALGYGGTARLVFRVKTNRGGDDDSGSQPGAYTSGYAGAAVLDDVEIDTGTGFVPIGTFEAPASAADSALTIDNAPAYPAAARWKATAKPPGTYIHHHDLATLPWNDVCGPVGAATRLCNMEGGVISFGDHDRSEAMTGGPLGSPEREVSDAIVSPVVNLVAPGPNAQNEMGITGDMVDLAEEFYLYYEMYGAAFDIFSYGQAFQPGFQSYPAVQSDGSQTWGWVRYPGFQYFWPGDSPCDGVADAAFANGMIRTSNLDGMPDSIRIVVRKIGQCFRFGLSYDCDAPVGAYVDNLSLALVRAPQGGVITLEGRDLFQDAFPANESPALSGTAAFDTCGAWIQTGRNLEPSVSNVERLTIAGDSAVVTAPGAGVRMDLVFRIAPGPGNYVVPGGRASGLRARPDVAAAALPGDGSFWSAYLADPGERSGPYAHGTSGTWAARWNPLAWNSARMDTAGVFVHPLSGRGYAAFDDPTRWATTYHESDPRYATLGILRNLCFVADTAAPYPLDVTCGRPNEAAWPPAWVTAVPASRTGVPAGYQSREHTKILPDGLFTPGTHVQYFFRREDAGGVTLAPDTNVVTPQVAEGSLDAHRWQQFAILPDAWKDDAYGGLGQACVLVVDWDDRGGNEALWVGAADSLGLTLPDRFGAHNGWHAAGGQDPNDPAAHVHANAQAGTHWDLYNVRGPELPGAPGTLGARAGTRETNPAARAFGKDARTAPTPAMLAAFYRLIVLLDGDLGNGGWDHIGPGLNHGADDVGILDGWLTDTLATAPRGLWVIGSGFVESEATDVLPGRLGAALADPNHFQAAGSAIACSDLVTGPLFGAPSGDVYGVRNACTIGSDVLTPVGGGAAAATFDASGWAASVAHAPTPAEPWFGLLDGFDLAALSGRHCEGSAGRLAYLNRALGELMPMVCGLTWTPTAVDVPGPRAALADGVTLLGHPSRAGRVAFGLSLAGADRVTLRIHDVSGRTVRVLADRRPFEAGRHRLDWDGTDGRGVRVPHGVYFAKATYEARGYTVARKALVLR